MFASLATILVFCTGQFAADEMSFARDDLGRLWARPKATLNSEWLPVCGAAPVRTQVNRADRTATTTTNKIVPVAVPTTKRNGTGEGRGVPIQETIRKLDASPKAPNTKNGGAERYDYLLGRLDELEKRLDSLQAAMEGVVRILEKQR